MNDISIEATTSPDKKDEQIIDEGLTIYNKSKIGEQKYTPVGCFARANGNVVGGITGNLFWNYLYIDMMWIDERHRGNGLGRKLIAAVEKLSIKNGIRRSHLCTASFQSLDFYKKCGYKIIGQLDDMPAGETEYFLYKKLD
ncbi:MAG: GNAT family N-acetyltransferase [Spirochaetales bacterium]|nr:GNAT family N-acetyltransferase [Spirochaetales bacterium]